MPKLDFDTVKDKFIERGYELLETDYKSAQQLLKYKCNNGHETTIRYKKFQKGQGCRYCCGYVPKTIDFIKEQFKLKGFVLLEDTYLNNRSRLKYLCSNNHNHYVSWANFQQEGYECPKCTRSLLDISIINNEFKQRGFKLIETSYKNNNTPLKYICQNNHEQTIS